MVLLDGAAGEAARLSEFAIRVGVLAPDEDPDLAAWEERLLALRRRLRGPGISAVLKCPNCDATVALDFRDDDLPRDTTSAVKTVDGIELRPLRLSDLRHVEVGGDAQARLELLLARATGRDHAWARDVLLGPSRMSAVTALEDLASGLDLQISTQCTECGAAIVAPFDVSQFVSAELQSSAQQLLEGVHRIASTYHWSETEILKLPRERRQAYLSRIERDAVRSEFVDENG